MQSISIFLDVTKVADLWWKNTDISRTQGVCNVFYILPESSLVRYNYAKFHHCSICVIGLRIVFKFGFEY